MTKYILILVLFCVTLWAWLIHHQRQFPRYEWYKPFKRRLRASVDEYCRVSKNLRSVKTLISKTENDLSVFDITSARRIIIQENLDKLKEKCKNLENKYYEISNEIILLYNEHEMEIESEKNMLNPQMLELRDLWRIYTENKL